MHRRERNYTRRSARVKQTVPRRPSASGNLLSGGRLAQSKIDRLLERFAPGPGVAIRQIKFFTVYRIRLLSRHQPDHAGLIRLIRGEYAARKIEVRSAINAAVASGILWRRASNG